MFRVGIIREGKIPQDNRVPLTPHQCQFLQKEMPGVHIVVQPCKTRCFIDEEYIRSGIEVNEDISNCDLLLGVKEVPVDQLLEGKTYMFFSHTKKKQAHNQKLLAAMIDKKITIVDYECLEHEDGQRILGFGFFAGVVGAHNGLMAYGLRTGAFSLCRVGDCSSYKALINTYFQLRLPNIKIAVTGSGRVAKGVLEVMNLLDIVEVEPDEYLQREFSYPVYVHLRSSDLYAHRRDGSYSREDFHHHPDQYRCQFAPYISQTDILMNGTYWDERVPRLFEWSDMLRHDFRIKTIADISDDKNGGVPCNLGDSTIDNPVYGVDPVSRQMIDPYQPGSIDIMAVGNLPNELPRDASVYFGDQLLKYVLPDIIKGGSDVIQRASILKDGVLTERYRYLEDYAKAAVKTDLPLV